MQEYLKIMSKSNPWNYQMSVMHISSTLISSEDERECSYIISNREKKKSMWGKNFRTKEL